MDGKMAAAGPHECMRPRALFVMIASFLCNGIIFGIINSYGVIYEKLQEQLRASGHHGASSQASVVGSTAIGVTFFLSPVAGILVDKFGTRLTTFVGGLLAASGMFLSSLFVDSVAMLCLTYGVCFGVGASLAYTPSLVILGQYFKRYLGLVNGFVTMGSSLFTITMPYALDALIQTVGLDGCLQCMGGLMSMIMFCGLFFKPGPEGVRAAADRPSAPDAQGSDRRSLLKQVKGVVNVSIWKKKKYVIWAIAVPGALFGYFVPYVHVVKFTRDTFKDEDGKKLLMALGVSSGLGRIIFGKIADIPKVDRIMLQQISFVSIGVLTMFLPLVKDFTLLIAIVLAMGLFDGCFISLLGPIAFEICGQSGASQAIGFLLGLCSIPLTIGPPIAGIIYDQTGSYKIPFILAGVPPIVGALALFLVRCVKQETETDTEQGAFMDSKPNIANGDCHSGGVLPPPPPSYKEAITDELTETVPLQTNKDESKSQDECEEEETPLNGEIENEEAESSLLSEITKAIVLPVGSTT